MSKHTMHFCCLNVPGGWQTGVWFSAGVSFAANVEDTYPIGPVFNKTTDLWAWQKDNLPDQRVPTAWPFNQTENKTGAR